MIALPPVASVTLTPLPPTAGPCAHPHVPARLARQPDVEVPVGAVPDEQYREVRILVSLDARGHVISAKVFQRSTAPKFDAYMIGVAKRASYVPEIDHCKPVPALYFYVAEYGEGTPAPTPRPR